MRPTRWLPALILTLAVACVPATAALAGPAPSAPSGTAWRCTTAAPSGACGPYSYPAITKSNGYNTYVGNNMWGCGSGNCGPQTVHANTPGDWQVTSNQAARNTAVLTYPDVQQLFTGTTGNGPAISSFRLIRSRFTETMPPASAGTIAEAGYDIWTSYSSDIMIWVDNQGRGTGGEIIFSLDHNEHIGTVHILATLRWLQAHRYVKATATIGQVDFGWEICSTGGQPETFTISQYWLHTA